jgi:DNA-directed RNA polymerase specialized sigma24 family protein
MDHNNGELLKYIKALLLLEVQRLNTEEEPIKPEVLLARAGLNAREIAELLGKNSTAVAKAIQRAAKARA